MLRNARYLLGNSSAGIRECPVFGVPAINVSTRQTGRANSPCIVNVEGVRANILAAINSSWPNLERHSPDLAFGVGNSVQLFIEAMTQDSFWKVSTQKLFNDI
jgi:UDP-N-acetylglucosamine 2-epimerase (hydrolysing)